MTAISHLRKFQNWEHQRAETRETSDIHDEVRRKSMGYGCYGILLLWDIVVMGNCCYGILLLWDIVVMGNCCYRILLLWDIFVMGNC